MSKYTFDRSFIRLLLTSALSAVLTLGGLAGVPLLAAGLVPLPVLAAEEGEEKDADAGENASEDANAAEDASENAARDTSEDAAEDAQLWSEDYYRASDTSGDLTEMERDELDKICLEFMKQYHADLTLLSISTEKMDGRTLEELAALYYEDCGFGYGEGKDGFQMVYQLDTDEVAVVPFGAAAEMVPESYLQTLEGHVASYRKEYGIFGPFYATTRMLNNYMEKNYAGNGGEADQSAVPSEAAAAGSGESSDSAGTSGSTEAPGSGETSGSAEAVTDPSARVGEGSDMPAWYPVDPSSFPKYHDESAPRVVDVADLFTEDEEQTMETRLGEIRAELQKDVVIFTDVSDYGLGHDIYSADFYDFNGYGIGDEYEGVVLYICMDPGNRGWWACCTGPQTRGLYTEEVANEIDDLLYEYMVDGRYYEGVSDWIENFRRLYRNGSPYLDDWAAIDPDTIRRTHNESSPRVSDKLGLLTEEELSSLSEKAKELSAKYDIDVVIHTALDPGTLGIEEYCKRYYYFGGYGVGDDFDGIQLTIFKRPEYTGYPAVSAYGKCAEKLTETNDSRLERRCEGELMDRDYYAAAAQWIEQTDHMMKTGRAPQSAMHWIGSWIIAALIGCIYAGISLFRAYIGMDTPAIAENANAYYVDGSLKMRKVSDTFLDMRTTKQYRPRETRSSGGSSSGGGRSSYSSSYKGSSGTSHSGSGRKF